MCHKNIVTSLVLLKDQVEMSPLQSALSNSLSVLIRSCEEFFKEWKVKAQETLFLQNLSQELHALGRSNAVLISDPKFSNYYYQLILEVTKVAPFNNQEKNQYDVELWICPITFNSTYDASYDHKFVALTSGYIYDKQGLLQWFEQSQNFIDPMTRKPLPQFDIVRLAKYSIGLKKLTEIEDTRNALKRDLIAAQNERFARSNLPWSDEIKKQFLTFHTADSPSYERAIAQSRLNQLIALHIVSEPNKKGPKKEENFSNLDLSGIVFSNQQMAHTDLRGANLSGCTFFNEGHTGNCIHADLSGANLEGARFLNLPQRGVCMKTTNFTDANLRNVDLTGIGNWGEINITNADFCGAYLYNEDGLKVSGPDLKKFLHHCKGVDTAKFDPTTLQDKTLVQASPVRSSLFSPVPPQPTRILRILTRSQLDYQRELQSIWSNTPGNNWARIRAILCDYTKNNSTLFRIFTGHWNRHHVDKVHQIYRHSNGKSPQMILNELKTISLVNTAGTLEAIIAFLEDKITPQNNVVANSAGQSSSVLPF